MSPLPSKVNAWLYAPVPGSGVVNCTRRRIASKVQLQLLPRPSFTVVRSPLSS
jgi:hypothetical protein